MVSMNEYYQNGMFSVENELFYENNKRLGYFEDEEKEEIKQNNHNKTVKRLNELREINIALKRDNKKYRKENNELRQENQRLTNKLNNTALELVDNCISQGKATEISEMSYKEFLDFRAKNNKPMELQL